MFTRLSLAVAATACALVAAPAAANAATVYDNIPSPEPGNLSSLGYQATSTDEFGGQVSLAGTERQNPRVRVAMSSWACETGSGTGCTTTPGATFNHPITLNVYNVGAGDSVGSLIATKTQTFAIPYRPSAHPSCAGGGWSPDGGATCFSGFLFPIAFDFSGQGVVLPDDVIVTVAYNTNTHGANPIGSPGPYESLNVGLTGPPSVGTLPRADDAYWDTSHGPFYCDGGAGGTDTLRLDDCTAPNDWTGFQPAIEIRTSANAGVTVNDNTTGPGPAGADCADPSFNTIQGAIDAVSPGTTILVCAGNYTGGANVNKRLSLLGAQAGVDARQRNVSLASESRITTAGINVGVSDANIDGFLVQDVGSGAPAFGPGLLLAAGTGDNRVVNTIFRSNIFGMYLTDEVPGETVVRHNLYDANNDGLNVQAGAGNGIYGDFGVNGARVDENRFTGNENSAMVLTEGSGRNSDVEITGNQVVDNQGITVLLTDDVLISGNTITDTNTPVSGGPFSAIVLAGDVDGATIANNVVSQASSAVRVVNAFDPDPNRDVTVTGNALLGNDYGIRIGDGGYNGLLEAHFNRIAVNATAGLANEDADESIDATNNWWGCNAGPGQVGCDAVTGAGVDSTPRLVLGLSANSASIFTGQTSEIKADLSVNSAGQSPTGNAFPNGTPVGFTTTLGTIESPVGTSNAAALSTLSAGATPGTATVTGTLDGQSVTTPVVITQESAGGTAGQVGGTTTTKTKKKCKKGKKLVGKKCKKKRKKKK